MDILLFYQKHIQMNRKTIAVFLTGFLFIFSAQVFANHVKDAAFQDIRITGTIKDKSGDPIVGVIVSILGTNKSASSDKNGKYAIMASKGQILIFSYIGMKKQNITVGTNRVIDVVLKDDEINLNEVVVNVGYGTMKRSDLTGSVSSITAKSYENSVSTTLDQALQGRVAGLQMAQNSGVPGGGSSIQIRGVSSISNTNEPIYVVDGVIINGKTGDNDVNAIASINPADIESVEILKDASATAIYGAQGANGVIIVTLKKGKEGIPIFNFNTKQGYQEIPKFIDMMNLREYAQQRNDMSDVLGYGRRADFANPSILGEGTNWQKELYSHAPMQTYDISVRGGNRASTYSISAGYLNQDGIVFGAGYKRGTFRVSTDNQVGSWVKMGGSVNVNTDKQETSVSSWSVIGSSLFQAPSIPVRNADGSYGGPTTELDPNNLSYANPVAIALLNQRNRDKFGTRGNMYLNLQPLKWFNFRTEFSGEGNIDNYQEFLPAYQFGQSVKASPDNRHDKTFRTFWSWKNLANFDKTFAKKHRMTLMVGQEMWSRYSDFLSGNRQGGSNELTGLDAGDATIAQNSGNSGKNTMFSIFSRLTYDYAGKYAFTGTIRRDGSSNFAPGHQWGTFPSAAAAWRISEEDFFKPLKDVVNNMKFRLSYGKVGNSNVSAFAYGSNLINVPTANWGPSFKTGNISNENLSWETTKSWNAGLDLNLFKNRIELIVDAYIKKTDDLLLRLSLPAFTGTGSAYPGTAEAPWYNIGAIQNKGVEFTLNTVNISKSEFSWNSALVFTLNRNMVTRMNTETADVPMYDYSNGNNIVTRTMTGSPVSQFYGYKYVGRINSAADFLKDNGNGTSTVIVPTFKYRKGDIINNTDPALISSTYIGDLLFADVNGDGIVNDADITNIGNPFPDFTFGFTNNFKYGNFDFSFFLDGAVGAKAFNILRSRTDDPRSSANVRKYVANYAKLGYIDGNADNKNIWNVYVLPGSDPDVGRMSVQNTNNSIFSSRFVEDVTYLRIQNITLGYRFPTKMISKYGLKGLRVYSNLQNVYTFSNYSGYDPLVGSQSGQSMLRYGVDGGSVPVPRIYTFGLDLNF